MCTLLITATGFSVVGTDENRNGYNKNNTTSNLEDPPPPTGLFEWSMFHYGLNNSGFSPSPAPDDDTLLWYKDIGLVARSNPTLSDERLYVAGIQGPDPIFFFCLNPFNGSEIWKIDIPCEVWGNPTVANNRVYILGSGSFDLFCIDAITGDILWSYPQHGHCSPKVVDDKVYFSSYGGPSNEGGFFCLNATSGDLIWSFDTTVYYEACTPAVVNGNVYVGNNDGIFYCLDADTGNEIWNYSTTGWGIWSSPSVVNNKVYVATDHLYCINAYTGDEIWNVSGIDTASSPAVAYGNVYIGNGVSDGKVYCFDADNGDLIWDSQSLGTSIWNAAAVADGKVYTCSNGNPAKFNCLDAYTGNIIWQYDFINNFSYSSPAVAYGNVYVGSDSDGNICAFGTPNEPPDIPVKPDGSSEGIVGVEYIFNTSTTDPEGDDVYYLFDWGDGNNSGWIGPYASGATVNASHTWTKGGDYEIRAKAHDGRRESNWSEALIITIENDSPGAPTITGEINGKKGTEYEYTFNAVDPDDHDVKYFIDWGDDNTEWTGYNPSGTDVKVKHTWSEKGTYNITAKAKDIYGAESNWSTLEVTMPKNKAFNFFNNLLNWLFERFPYVFPILRHLLGLI